MHTEVPSIVNLDPPTDRFANIYSGSIYMPCQLTPESTGRIKMPRRAEIPMLGDAVQCNAMRCNAMQCNAVRCKPGLRKGGEGRGGEGKGKERRSAPARSLFWMVVTDGWSQTRRAALSLLPSLHSFDRNPWPIQRRRPPGTRLHAAEKTIAAEDIEMEVWAVRRRLLARRQQVNDRVIRRSVLHT